MPGFADAIIARYARTVSRTSMMSRSESRLPIASVGGPLAGLDLGDLLRDARRDERRRLPRPDVIERSRNQRRNPIVFPRALRDHFLRELAGAVRAVRADQVVFGDRAIERRVDERRARDQDRAAATRRVAAHRTGDAWRARCRRMSRGYVARIRRRAARRRGDRCRSAPTRRWRARRPRGRASRRVPRDARAANQRLGARPQPADDRSGDRVRAARSGGCRRIRRHRSRGVAIS